MISRNTRTKSMGVMTLCPELIARSRPEENVHKKGSDGSVDWRSLVLCVCEVVMPPNRIVNASLDKVMSKRQLLY